jgi:hypothetical protein
MLLVSNMGIGQNQTSGYADQESVTEVFAEKLPNEAKVYLYNLGRLTSGNVDFQLDTLQILYQEVTCELTPLARSSLLKGVIHEVRSTRLSPLSLLSVAISESDPDIVDLALVSLLELSQVKPENQFAAVNIAVRLLQDERTVNRGAVHASLACFGDRRVCAILRNSRIHVTLAVATDLYYALARPRRMKLATLDYLLGWVIDQHKTLPRELLDTLTFAVSAYVVCSSDPDYVYDSTFNFGMHCFPNYTPELVHNYSLVLPQINSLLQSLEASEIPAVSGLAEIIKNPAGTSTHELESQWHANLRQRSDRRDSDRRVINIAPYVERRSTPRRMQKRRHMQKHTI